MKKGFITILAVILVFVVSISLLSIFLIRQEIFFLNNVYLASQAYYLAESGIRDALLRIKNNPSLNDFSYSFEAEKGNIKVDISENIGGVLTIISEGKFLDNTQRIRVRYQIDLESVSFYYGAQAGEGGVIMENNSIIKGNIFSNGSVLGGQGAEITDSVISAGEKIEKIETGKDAQVYNCFNSSIQGDLFYVTSQDCDVSGNTEKIEEIEPIDFPISDEAIEKWKTQTEEGQIIEGDYNVSGIDSLASGHIKGNLYLDVGSTLKLKGIVLVAGDLTIKNNAVLELDGDYYDDLSGVIIVEGKTRIRPGAVLRGSGEQGSYIMVVSLNESLENAVQIDNTSDAGIFYVPYGAVLLNQRVKIREATAYKIILQEKAEIEYEIGLENIFFSSGSGGSWEILSWEKIK